MMVEARSSSLWDHTAEIIALHVNIHRNPKKQRRVFATDFHPHIERKQRRRIGMDPERWWNAAVRGTRRK